MDKKTIGILGGMGPLATANLFEKIILHTDAHTDQEHLHIVIDNNTAIPDRTKAILHGGENPLPYLKESVLRLVNAGAEVIAIPCNTSHYFYDALCAQSPVPILNMIALTREEMAAHGIRRAALLATDGAIQTGVYQKVFEGSGIELLTPDEAGQKEVMRVIYDGIKSGTTDFDTSALQAVLDDLLLQGAETFILGCTELPLAFTQYHLSYPTEDPTLALALGAIRAAGGKTK